MAGVKRREVRGNYLQVTGRTAAGKKTVKRQRLGVKRLAKRSPTTRMARVMDFSIPNFHMFLHRQLSSKNAALKKHELYIDVDKNPEKAWMLVREQAEARFIDTMYEKLSVSSTLASHLHRLASETGMLPSKERDEIIDGFTRIVMRRRRNNTEEEILRLAEEELASSRNSVGELIRRAHKLTLEINELRNYMKLYSHGKLALEDMPNEYRQIFTTPETRANLDATVDCLAHLSMQMALSDSALDFMNTVKPEEIAQRTRILRGK